MTIVTGIILLPVAQCFTPHGAFLHSCALIFYGTSRVICVVQLRRPGSEREGLAQGHTAAKCTRRKGPRSPRSGRGHRDASSRAFPRPLPRMWAVGAGAVLLGTGPGLARDAQAWGGIGRRQEAGAPRRGSALGAGAGRGRGHPPRPPQDPPPSANARYRFSGAAAESGRGGGEGGGIPEGIPPPTPASRRPRTHVSSRPARIPRVAQRVPAPRRCLRSLVPAPALCRPWQVPAASARRFAGLRLLYLHAGRRPRSGQAAPADLDAGEWGPCSPASSGALRFRAGGIPGGFGSPNGQAGGAPPVPLFPSLDALCLSSFLTLRIVGILLISQSPW